MSDALQSSAETRRCQACGTKVRADARFCGNCGVKLPQSGDLDVPSLIGTMVAGAYRVEGVIGTGSMGVVYRAEQLALRRKVALKVIGESTDDDTTRARFRREARAASQLNHPNVVQVYDFGQLPGGQPYLAMELLKGQTLEQLLETSFPLELDRVLRLQIDILAALQAAHNLGILHRDLKPANVFISQLPSGREVAKVLDFGIATAMDSTLTGTQTWAPLTEAGFVCGTPAFMSPEQVQGFPLDQRSDLFSAAGLLYQTMTCERPFRGKSPVEVGANIVLKPLIPASRLRPELGLPDILDAFLLTAMSKQPDDRYATADEMIVALREILAKLEADTDPDLMALSDEIPETAEWPESLTPDDASYPDTVVEQQAVSAEDIAASGAASAQQAGAKAALPAKALLPTPFASIDTAGLGLPKPIARGPAAGAPPPAEPSPPHATASSSDPTRGRQRPTLGRPDRASASPPEAQTSEEPSPSDSDPAPKSARVSSTTADELHQLKESQTAWLPWILLVGLAIGLVVWLVFFSPWSAEFG